MLETETRGKPARKATGFVVRHDERAYLISNGHVFSGKDPITGKSDHCPDALTFRYWKIGDTSALADHREPLQHDAQPVWLEHPILGSRADVAALPLHDFAADRIGVYDPWLPRFVDVGVGDDVTVVGFPFGVNINSLAIWTRASIATEYEADYQGLPVFLVDARTRDGQSGSPVIFFRTGGYLTKYGALYMPPMKEPQIPGRPIDEHAPRPDVPTTEEFLGIYSGRIDERSDLGFVWRKSVIREVFEGRRVARW
jgi:hypothetical protein